MLKKVKEILKLIGGAIYNNKPERLWRIIVHVPVGIVTVLLSQVETGGTALAVLFTIGFFIYELNEDSDINDKAWKDIVGWLWGVAIMGLILLVV